jgi:hypothetical protein
MRQKLASALATLKVSKEQRSFKGSALAAAEAVKELRSQISAVTLNALCGAAAHELVALSLERSLPVAVVWLRR